MNIAVCDNDEFYVDSIVKKINSVKETQDIKINVDSFKNSVDFIEKFCEKKYDLVYLEIELGAANGIDIAEMIHKIKPSTMIIFISKYSEYVNLSFVVKAFQFLKKPLKEGLFISELERAIKQYRSLRKSFVFQTYQGNFVFNIDDIMYMETAYREYRIHTLDRSYYGSINAVKSIKDELLEYDFYRIQRSFFINLTHVSRFDNTTVTMKNGDVLTLSRKKYKDFKTQFYKFLDKGI